MSEPNPLLDELAQAIHEVCWVGDPPLFPPSCWGQMSLRPWEELPEDVRDQWRAIAQVAFTKLGLTWEVHTYEAFEAKAEMGGEGALRYGGQTCRSLGYRTQTRLIGPWITVGGDQ